MNRPGDVHAAIVERNRAFLRRCTWMERIMIARNVREGWMPHTLADCGPLRHPADRFELRAARIYAWTRAGQTDDGRPCVRSWIVPRWGALVGLSQAILRVAMTRAALMDHERHPSIVDARASMFDRLDRELVTYTSAIDGAHAYCGRCHRWFVPVPRSQHPHHVCLRVVGEGPS